MIPSYRGIRGIMPPYILKRLLESKDKEVREAALKTLMVTSRLRGERSVWASTSFAARGTGRRTIYDCKHGLFLPFSVVVRTENTTPSSDEVVNLAFEGLGITRQFYKEVFNRNSVNGRGMRLDGYVHYDDGYNNAFWDGQEMVFGDGDGVIFCNFTKSLDVIAHELTHGVTTFTANFDYHKESGALNESTSDVFGTLVKQWSLGQRAEDADWLIGADIFTPGIEADALRSMKAPGTAYDNELLGQDPQPDHMDGFVILPDSDDGDWGGVHINSGIPNKAFYLMAMTIGGYAWETPGHIWYESLLASHELTQFQGFADTTYFKAGQLYGRAEQRAVAEAWRAVGIQIAGVSTGTHSHNGKSGGSTKPTVDSDTLFNLAKQMDVLTTQIKVLNKDVKALKEVAL